MEFWRIINEAPDYEINTKGEIRSCITGKEILPSFTEAYLKVSLATTSGRITRSVKTLVANAFLEIPDIESTAVIVLDNNQSNVDVENLAWRPRWFAWKYANQFKIIPPHYRVYPIVNVTMNISYDSVVDCAMTEGLLFGDIWRSAFTAKSIWPSNCLYEIIQEQIN